MSAEDGYRARLADYSDRTPAGFENLSDDDLRSRLEARGFTASTAARMVEVREEPAAAAYIAKQLPVGLVARSDSCSLRVSGSPRMAEGAERGGVGRFISQDLLRVPASPTSEQCRYAWNPGHRCTRRDGRPLLSGETCHLEASAQVYGRTA